MIKIQTPPPEVHDAWSIVWRTAAEAVLEFVPAEQREELRLAVEAGVDPDAPMGWLRRVADIMARERPNAERLTGAFSKIKVALIAYRDQCNADPMFFPSPVGQELLGIAHRAFFFSTAGYREVWWPILRTSLEGPDVLALPRAATRQEGVAFENWVNRFRRSLHQVIERWYRPLLAAFYRLDRLPSGGVVPPEQFELGNLMVQARAFWGHGTPLAALVDEQIVTFRNSEAHAHSEVDIKNEVVVFRNRSKLGDIKAEWTATASDIDVLARHVVHHGELMRAVFCVFPLAELDIDPVELAEAFVLSFKDAPPNQSLQTDEHLGRCAPSVVRR